MSINKISLGIALTFGVGLSVNAQQVTGFFPQDKNKEATLEQEYLKAVKFDQFKVHLKELTKAPHIAGTPENEKVAAYMTKVMSEAGMEVTSYPYDVYLPNHPGESVLEIITPDKMTLSQQEGPIDGDPFSTDPRLHKGFNAYSGSGDVTAEVVYVNYGVKADFEKLAEMGVDLKGKVAIARYGGNFRGYKAKFAEQYGAAALIIFTDPKDSGFGKGEVYPDGPFFNETTIQRGSLLTLDYTGDPLTPFEPALPLDGDKKVKRLDPKDVAFHTIPVSPIGYGAAKEILSRMKGSNVPEGWQGGLPFEYKITGGSDLKVRVKVDQPVDYIRANNIVGKFVGSEYPDEWIILGSHYDAWSFGATDPNSGTSMMLTLAEAIGELVKNGEAPKRSILIGHWDAEEQGVIGSTEWVEHFVDELGAKAVIYMNFDGAVSGRNFGISSAPTLKNLIIEASKEVAFPDSAKTVFEVWAGKNDEPRIGNLGGGSDHIAFYMYAGVPSMSGGSGGTSAYHSNYDNFHYYSKFVDPTFKMGGTVASVIGVLTLRLANATIIPYDVPRYAQDLRLHFDDAVKSVKEMDPSFTTFGKVDAAIAKLKSSSAAYESAMNAGIASGDLSDKQVASLNKDLISLEKSWLDPKGMYFGSWYRSLYVSNDPFSGYASWILPGIKYEVETKSSKRLKEWDSRYAKAILDLSKKVKKMTKSLK
ncbi:N-acetylated-alpha-linked acidic dipeptidase [Algoriphagus ratkowskyi]|uniref:M28 family peptidase n=1 Tax=Algoriphagus ratkowskyi TaxID=57028 RepID=A0A2W7R7K3_9BACT|nr:M28 family peptidase [Algoriphagus ratkowskyi]PZX56833.1 N-acetylated-alpha-linked acidic dipeptidase [Algoriphagus ratkowskyi]TXD79749.1 M28 family peptidase [Algoriphagus ratkowskyi]